jgi:hypothetical protein
MNSCSTPTDNTPSPVITVNKITNILHYENLIRRITHKLLLSKFFFDDFVNEQKRGYQEAKIYGNWHLDLTTKTLLILLNTLGLNVKDKKFSLEKAVIPPCSSVDKFSYYYKDRQLVKQKDLNQKKLKVVKKYITFRQTIQEKIGQLEVSHSDFISFPSSSNVVGIHISLELEENQQHYTMEAKSLSKIQDSKIVRQIFPITLHKNMALPFLSNNKNETSEDEHHKIQTQKRLYSSYCNLALETLVI